MIYRKENAGLTIVDANYLKFALCLAESFIKCNEDYDFYIFLLDGSTDLPNIDSRIRIVNIDESITENFFHRAFYYEITELSTSVKPDCLIHILNMDYKRAVYVDPDIYFYSSLTKMNQLLNEYNVVITPHTTEEIYDGNLPDDLSFLRAGVYNLGFIGFANNKEARDILSWWSQRLALNAFTAFSRGMFTDQKWIDLLPAYFDGVFIFKDPTYNVAYWNLHSRNLEKKFDIYLVNGENLTFFHFSGINLDSTAVSKHTNRFVDYNSYGLGMISLFEDYKRKVKQMERSLSGASKGYKFDYFVDKSKINILDRLIYFQFFIEGGRIDNIFNMTKREFYKRIRSTKIKMGRSIFSRDDRVDKYRARVGNLPEIIKRQIGCVLNQEAFSLLIKIGNNSFNKINISSLIYPLYRSKDRE